MSQQLSPQPPAAAPGEGHSHRSVLVAIGALLLGMLLAALDQTIVLRLIRLEARVFVGVFHFDYICLRALRCDGPPALAASRATFLLYRRSFIRLQYRAFPFGGLLRVVCFVPLFSRYLDRLWSCNQKCRHNFL